MNVSQGHVLYPLYRLWIYILTKFLFQMWFIKQNRGSGWYDEPKTEPNSYIPTSLCPFLNRLVFYFLIQVPMMFIGFGILSMIVLGSQIHLLMAWFITGDLIAAFDVLDAPVGSVGAMFIGVELVLVIAIVLMMLRAYMRENREKKWVQSVYAATDAVGETPRLFFKPVLYPWHILSMWYEARHDKFCPTLTFNVKQEESTSEKQE